MISMKASLEKITPIQFLVMGYVVIILIGSLLLRTQSASSVGTSQSYIDALFTATSAVSTTGLIVEDTGSFYSFFGQSVILLLFQIGGIGYMAFVVLMVYAVGKKPSLTSAITLQESLSGITLGNMKKYLKAVFFFTLGFEGVGALLLALFWAGEYPLAQSFYLGIFHSVSAFCTSGFSLFSTSFMSYDASGIITVIICSISIAGGIGFIVLSDIRSFFERQLTRLYPRQLSLHSKLSLFISGVLMVMGIIILFSAESGVLPLKRKILVSVFQSISASTTTGFNTIDIGSLSQTSLFTLVILMFIGAAPGGSGGGIKVTAFGSMILFVWAVLKGRQDVDAFSWRIPWGTVRKSFVIGFMMLGWVLLATMMLTITEHTSFVNILFEVVSAAGTVGLSTGITAGLTATGKFLLIITMVIGRVGPLAIAFSLIGEPKPVSFRRARGDIFIG
jgi:trk system potassium uptake protein TrkH